MDIVAEVWRSIPEYAGDYEASNIGRVRSLDRIKSGIRFRGKMLSLTLGKRGYLTVKIGKYKRRYVHHLVALAFIGPRPNELQVNHINGIRTDNRLDNLEYTTCIENIRHAFRMGLVDRRGSNNGRAKLTPDNVQFIRESELKGKELAAMFGCGTSTIHRAKTSRSWKHVTK